MATGSPHRETGRAVLAFQAWYEAHRSFRRVSRDLALPERTLQQWAQWFGWHARADRRDAEAARIADAEAVNRRAEMLKRHRQAGELLTRRGLEHLAHYPIEKASDAIRAIQIGIEIERTADGMPAWVARIMTASEGELKAMQRELSECREPAPDELERLGYGESPDE